MYFIFCFWITAFSIVNSSLFEISRGHVFGADCVWQAHPANIIGKPKKSIIHLSTFSLRPLSSHNYSFLCAWWHQSKEHRVEIKRTRKSVLQRRKRSDVFIHKSLCGLSVRQGGWIELVASVVLICQTFQLNRFAVFFFSSADLITANNFKLVSKTTF